ISRNSWSWPRTRRWKFAEKTAAGFLCAQSVQSPPRPLMCRVSIARSALRTFSRRFGSRARSAALRYANTGGSLHAHPDLLRALLLARVSPVLIQGLLHARVSPDLIRGLFCVWCLRMGDPGSALRLAGNSGVK